MATWTNVEKGGTGTGFGWDYDEVNLNYDEDIDPDSSKNVYYNSLGLTNTWSNAPKS